MIEIRPSTVADTAVLGFSMSASGRVGGGGETSAPQGGADAISLPRYTDIPAPSGADMGSRGTSLGSIATNGHRGFGPHPCGGNGIWGARIDGGDVFPMRCNRLRCERCLHGIVALRQQVLANSTPTRFMTITLVAPESAENPWAVARVRIKRMFEKYRELTNSLIEYSVVIEHNPRGTGYHAHFLLKGDFVKQGLMQQAAVAAGCGTRKPDLRMIKWGSGQSTAGYGLKSFAVAGYSLKGHGAGATEALRINGGRLEHHSRGFISVGNKPVLLKEAETYAKRQRGRGSSEMPSLMLFLSGKRTPFRIIDGGRAFYPDHWARQQPNGNPTGFHPDLCRYIE